MKILAMMFTAMVFCFTSTDAEAQALDLGTEFAAPGAPVEYMAPVVSATGSQGLDGTIVLTPHIEGNASGNVYTQICNYIQTAVTGASEQFVLYSITSNNEPGDLLWTSAVQPTGTNLDILDGVCADFASGTWETAGASYQDGSGNLQIDFLQGVLKGRLKTTAVGGLSNQNERYIQGPRSLGVDPTNLLGNIRGFDLGVLTPPASVSGAYTLRTANIPFLPLVP